MQLTAAGALGLGAANCPLLADDGDVDWKVRAWILLPFLPSPSLAGEESALPVLVFFFGRSFLSLASPLLSLALISLPSLSSERFLFFFHSCCGTQGLALE